MTLDLRSELAVKKPVGDSPSSPRMPEMPNGGPDHDKEIASSPRRTEGFITPAATPARSRSISHKPFQS